VPTDPERDLDRLQDPLAYERGFWSRGVRWVAGVDEVGRGPLAGPVLAAAVVLPRECRIDGAADSKMLNGIRREHLAREVRGQAAALAVGAASVREIDEDGIVTATMRAMARALAGLPFPPDHVVVDGLPVRGLRWEHDAVVRGDGRVHCIACASIVAKVVRDGLMRRLAPRYPAYRWHTNVGYGTPAHLDALRRFGPSPHHRRTFRSVQLDAFESLSTAGGCVAGGLEESDGERLSS
jgi:ribonuclease HII